MAFTICQNFKICDILRSFFCPTKAQRFCGSSVQNSGRNSFTGSGGKTANGWGNATARDKKNATTQTERIARGMFLSALFFLFLGCTPLMVDVPADEQFLYKRMSGPRRFSVTGRHRDVCKTRPTQFLVLHARFPRCLSCCPLVSRSCAAVLSRNEFLFFFFLSPLHVTGKCERDISNGREREKRFVHKYLASNVARIIQECFINNYETETEPITYLRYINHFNAQLIFLNEFLILIQIIYSFVK